MNRGAIILRNTVVSCWSPTGIDGLLLGVMQIGHCAVAGREKALPMIARSTDLAAAERPAAAVETKATVRVQPQTP